jgi:hypothetical protein
MTIKGIKKISFVKNLRDKKFFTLTELKFILKKNILIYIYMKATVLKTNALSKIYLLYSNRILETINFIKNPVDGGRPAIDKKILKKIIFFCNLIV